MVRLVLGGMLEMAWHLYMWGDEVEVLLEHLEDQEGSVVLSKKKADFMRVWERIRENPDFAAVVVEEGFDSLKRAIQRVATPQIHPPFNARLERQLYPRKDRIVAAVQSVL